MSLIRQLEDLYIKEAHRGAGQGKRLFGELGAVAKEKGCSRVEWRVLKVSSVPARLQPLQLPNASVEQAINRLLCRMLESREPCGMGHDAN